jgi:two-component system, LytTR family, response regulator
LLVDFARWWLESRRSSFLMRDLKRIRVDIKQMDARQINTLIVDDEPIARKVLREELAPWPEITIVGEADNGRDALLKIGKFKPDLVFLDLQMPVMSGFEVVRSLTEPPLPVVVVVTAFDQHAIQAFEAGAIDYLLKPVSQARLEKTIERVKNIVNRPSEVANQIAQIASVSTPSNPTKSRKVVGRNGADYILLDADEVLAFQAQRELVWIITAKQRLLATQSLRAIEDRLREAQFQRVHRNAIVNVNHVRKLTALSSQRWSITLSNSLQLVVAKRQAHKIRHILQW